MYLNFKYLFVTIFFVSTILLSCKNDTKTTNNNNNQNDTDAKNIVTYELPTELEYSNHTKDVFLYDKFYPIGWSKTGHLAYIVEKADEGSGYYFFRIVIQNLINDKTNKHFIIISKTI